jgi:hypothetical protein
MHLAEASVLVRGAGISYGQLAGQSAAERGGGEMAERRRCCSLLAAAGGIRGCSASISGWPAHWLARLAASAAIAATFLVRNVSPPARLNKRDRPGQAGMRLVRAYGISGSCATAVISGVPWSACGGTSAYWAVHCGLTIG